MQLTPEKFIEEILKNGDSRNFKSWNKILNGIKKDRSVRKLVLKNIDETLTIPNLKKSQIKSIINN